MEKVNEVFLEITLNCNLACKHCYTKKDGKELSREEWFLVIDKLKKFNPKRCILIGGEPTLHQDFWDILSYSISSFREVIVETNGTTKSYFADYDCTVAVSFESCYKDKNDKIRRFASSDRSVYDLAIKKLLDGKKHDNPCVLRQTLYNDTDVLGSIVLAEKLGANLVLMPLIKLGRAEEMIHRIPSAKKIREAMETCMKANLRMKGYHQVQVPQWYLVNIDLFNKYSPLFRQQAGICAAGKQRLFVDYKGNVKPCMFLPQASFGNILKDNIRSVNKKIREFNGKVEEIEPEGKCKDCDGWDFCHGGRLCSYFSNKSKMGENCPLKV